MTVFTEQIIRQMVRSAVSSMSLSGIHVPPEMEEQLVQQQIEKHKDPDYRPGLRRWRGEEHSATANVPDGA